MKGATVMLTMLRLARLTSGGATPPWEGRGAEDTTVSVSSPLMGGVGYMALEGGQRTRGQN